MRHKTIRSIAAIALLTGYNAHAATAAGSPAGSSMITMDYANYLAPIDLHFTKPTQPIEGIPLGNGKIGYVDIGFQLQVRYRDDGQRCLLLVGLCRGRAQDWDVNFKLHALYNTTVEGELRGG